ncbi:MAG TPA: hypothetical protein VGG37_07700 [Opitutaceae bacterium]|jgi:hypothetical protein
MKGKLAPPLAVAAAIFLSGCSTMISELNNPNTNPNPPPPGPYEHAPVGWWLPRDQTASAP